MSEIQRMIYKDDNGEEYELKVGIPYITEGSTESNLSIQVKCSFPETNSETNQNN